MTKIFGRLDTSKENFNKVSCRDRWLTNESDIIVTGYIHGTKFNRGTEESY